MSNYKKNIFMLVSISLFVVVVSITKFRSGEINYLNSDATWHTIYTMKCYEETSISEHKFLPIVTFGEDKWIKWGDGIPDEYGNFYYTSFSPAGYVMPYIFIKALHLGYTENALYIYNTTLFAVSTCILALFLLELFKNNKDKYTIAILGSLIYVLQPELLHGMGIVYWHQSLMQLTLLMQLYAFYKRKDSKGMNVLFIVMCIINPYIEWTGYVANVGYAIVVLFDGWEEDKFKSLVKAGFIGVLTLISLSLFCGHYLLNVESDLFFTNLRNRFFTRGITSGTPMNLLFKGYITSFKFTWLILSILVICVFIVSIVKKPRLNQIVESGLNDEGYKSILLRQKWLLFVTLFPVLENIIMKQHAVAYTYDRMKLIFPIVILSCDLIGYLFYKSTKTAKNIIILICVSLLNLNLIGYINDEAYTFETDFRSNNEAIGSYISNKYQDSILGCQTAVRGYLNMTFERGIYEFVDANWLKNKASEQGVQYAIQVIIAPNIKAQWNLYDIKGAKIFDLNSGEKYIVKVSNGEVVEEKLSSRYETSNLTNESWTNGIRNAENIILFNYDEWLLADLECSTKLVCNTKEFKIEKVSYDSEWINVTVDGDAKECAYPNYISLE